MGWPTEAIDKFNVLHKKILVDREEHFGWDVGYLIKKRNEVIVKKKKSDRNGIGRVVQKAANDLLDVVNWKAV